MFTLRLFVLSLILFIIFFFDVYGFPQPPQTLNDRPIIGILTQPSPHSLGQFGDKYIAASYVKYVECAGARVVPVFHNETQQVLKKTFNSINGLLLPGGGASIAEDTQLYQASRFLFSLAVEANNNGDYFPLSGHCQGYEILSEILTNDFNILSWVDAENLTLPLNFTNQARSSRIFQDAPERIYNIYQDKPVTLNNHHWAVTPHDFETKLSKLCTPISTNVDRRGVEFVSTYEMKDYPIWAIQWHSEKPLFEWNPTEVINHSGDAVEAMQYLARYLVSEARKNLHTYPTPQAAYNAMIYNYPPIYTEHLISDFEQCYVWGNPTNSTTPPE